MVTFFADFTGLETVRFFGRRTAFAISAAFAWQIKRSSWISRSLVSTSRSYQFSERGSLRFVDAVSPFEAKFTVLPRHSEGLGLGGSALQTRFFKGQQGKT
jgi:hypothetical protein